MTLELIQNHDKLFAEVTDELGRKNKADLTPLLILGKDTERLLPPLIAEIRLKRPITMSGQLRRLRSLGEAFEHIRMSSLPNTEWGWQQLILDVHRFILTRTNRKSTLQTRLASEWAYIRTFFLILVEHGLIPVSAHIPPTIEVLSTIDVSRYGNDLLGQGPPEADEATGQLDKLLVSVSLSRTDSEYLEEVRDTLAARRAVLYKVLTDYWFKIKQNLEFGRTLLATVDWPSLKAELDSSEKSSLLKYHPANPLNGLDGLANYLAVIKYHYKGCPPSIDTLRKNKDKSVYLPREGRIGSVKTWIAKIDLPPNFINQQTWSVKNILWWWQGRISHLDVSMITALLIMLQPSWTPHAILHATVSSRKGKQYLDFPDNGASFEVKKPRAGAMKDEVLDPISLEIIRTLIDEGASLRMVLAKADNPLSTLLMIPYGKKAVSSPIFSGASSFLSGYKNNRKTGWIGTLYPELEELGLGAGTISFSKIRKTEGILEWFKTKSIKAVSKKLGNTERVVLDHYIPTPLLNAWNTRLIRRFQNLWITTAAAEESFLLDVTDFSTLEDLHSFLRDMLQLHQSSSSPLAEALHQKFDILSPESLRLTPSNGHLHVAISTNTLIALYSYQSHLISLGLSNDLLDKKDSDTGFTPRQFLSIADLLQARLPLDKNPHYRTCHDAALVAVEAVASRTRWPTLREEIL